MPARLLTLVALASRLVFAQVYVPGQIEDTPGAAMVTMGAGVDGYTTYVINGGESRAHLSWSSLRLLHCSGQQLTWNCFKPVTLQENAASAVMTQYDAQGIPAVYNCVLGADAQWVLLFHCYCSMPLCKHETDHMVSIAREQSDMYRITSEWSRIRLCGEYNFNRLNSIARFTLTFLATFLGTNNLLRRDNRSTTSSFPNDNSTSRSSRHRRSRCIKFSNGTLIIVSNLPHCNHENSRSCC